MLSKKMMCKRVTLFGPLMKMKPQILPPSVKAVHKPRAAIKEMDFNFMINDSFRRFAISLTFLRSVITLPNSTDGDRLLLFCHNEGLKRLPAVCIYNAPAMPNIRIVFI